MKQHYRRSSLVMVCILGAALAGAVLAEDDMEMDGQSGAMAQQPANASTPAAPHAPDPMPHASQYAPVSPDAMTVHMEEMAAMMLERGRAMEVMGRQMQDGSMQMHQQAMLMKAGDASAQNDMDMSATMQHMQQMKEDMERCEMQMNKVDATMQSMGSSMGGGMAKMKMGHM